ncbi:MAG: hypothetical protein CMF52_02540 [Legionellales bacterium]|nr:hypothetical protein [Legionellales bacterium]
MARLRQQHPQNYVNSGNIHTDFENVIRYVNSAELGDKTIAELMGILFNEEGVFRGPIEMRIDANSGIQYRVGQYTSAEDGWITIADITTFRGTAGASVGNVEGPFFFNRQDVVIGGPVASITVAAGGTGYTTAPTVTIAAPTDTSGTTATGTATIDANGVVTGITVTSGGTLYSTVPTVTLSGGNGTGATATAVLGTANNVVAYSYDPSTEDLNVYKNGILLNDTLSDGTAAQYVKNSTANTVTINTTPAPALGDKITIFSIRSQSVTNFRREDKLISGSTTVVAFVHTDDEKILVWRNGILQEAGGSADYLSSAAANTITFLDTSNPLNTGDKITLMTVENQSLKTVAGLMFEDEYTTNGYINFSKVSVTDNQIPQIKVANLSSGLAGKANLVSQSTTPLTAVTGDLHLDTSQTPAILKFYDGTQWLETSPESSLPTFIQTNAGQYVRVNGTGTALEYGDIDVSALVPKTYMGAANGVATLDTSGNLPVTQLPETFSTISIPFFSVHEDSSATVTNKTYFLTRFWKQTIRIDGIAFKTNGGTCTIQLSVDGSLVGTTHSVTSTLSSISLPTVIEINATVASRRLELVTTNNSSAQSLEVCVAAASVNV